MEKIKNTINENISQAEKSLSDLYLTTGETITSYQQAVKNYKDAALTAVEAKISIASNALDNINTILSDNDAKYFLGAENISLIDVAKNNYTQANAALTQAKASQASPYINQSLTDTLNVLNKTFSALKDCYNLLEVSVVGMGFTQTNLDTYKTTVSTQQANVSGGITWVQTAQNNLNDSNNNLNNAILAAKKDNVLIIPSRAVIEKNSKGKFARLLILEEVKEAPVAIGLRGDDGLVEVLSGLNEGDTVVTYIQTNK
ncbi:hypothetical protein KKA93_02015 [Patescibacteria group bacterium]|nr:hypothetical protein [Patescibacteria group bacterium]MBU1663366.1 hypothetical protein [Patescibacteria group bacterium]MBU1934345.1 hypothetical protein [Patescibacteria group bacterium]MBU2007608.1 hypothetical protein [Patescibacteria group bacterium]MBU2233383.1 hypothetical protein [Patescibacteria group bacterium]